jgi:predicted ATPase/class 3 adenylate cyclase
VAELPSGTVTFLFTDLEGSTRLWEDYPDAMHEALARHNEIVRAAIAGHDGQIVKTTGDGFHAVFTDAACALDAAVGAQRGLGSEFWSTPGELRVRMGLHSGAAECRDGDYPGPTVNKAARVMSVANGGQVLVSAATVELVRDGLGDGVTLMDLGEHRLRDLSRAERLFQVRASGLREAFPPLRSLEALPGNLPLQLTSFVGRDDELVVLAKMLGVSRLVTLTGVGGVGKTRLALQVAAEVAPRYRDGAWLCELAAVRDAAGVVDAVASVFQVTARPGMTLEESLVAYLGEQELLVVLDNCEHVLRPVAALVRVIEGASPRVRVVATSREGLGVRGEQIIAVPSLEVPDNTTDLVRVSACEAVRLFVDRARGVKASFVVDAGNAEAVAQVCRRLDGVPLAIELAAARITTMNPAELARRLDRRFRLLTGGDRDAIERHQTLQATIDWSYDLLTEREQRLLDRLSVFAGGCTLEAVEAVCAGDPIDVDDVYELLANLVARSLVVVDDGGPDTRYRLLETIRQYGEERLAEHEETDILRTRHCDWYSDFARVVQGHSFGPAQIEWGARLARDHDNLLAAMAFALATRDLERAMRLVRDLPSDILQVDDVVRFDPEPVLALPSADDHPASAVALMLAASQASVQGDDPGASELCDRALGAEQRLGPIPDAHLAMFASYLRGQLAFRASLNREAAEHYVDASRHARADDLPGMTALLLGIGSSMLRWEDPAAALSLATEALALARQAGAPIPITRNLINLAAALAVSDPDQARVLLDESLQLAATLGYEATGLFNDAAFTAGRLAEWPTSLRTASRALHLQLRSGGSSPVYLAMLLNLVARGLAEPRPEPAAVIQGTIGIVLQRATPNTAAPHTGDAAHTNTAVTFIVEVRHDTTQLIVAALGEPRMRELRAQGAAMTEDQAYTYARTHIDDYLATNAEHP